MKTNSFKMFGSVKTMLRKYKDSHASKKTANKSANCVTNEQGDSDSGGNMKEFNEIGTDQNSKSEDSQPFVDVVVRKFPCPNMATFLVITLLIKVFVILPVIYLLHCFDLLNTHWPNDEFRRVLTDHSHSNPRKDNHYYHSVLYHPYNDSKQHLSELDDISKLPLPEPALPSQCSSIPNAMKFDCYPEEGSTEDKCKKRGCCWAPAGKSQTENSSLPLDVPYCFYPQGFGGYTVHNITHAPTGITAFLKRSFKSPYPNDVPMVKMVIMYGNEQQLRLKLYDPSSPRFEPPYPEVPSLQKAVPQKDYRVEVDTQTGGVKIIRDANNITIFNTQNVGALILADQFLQLSSLLPSRNVYGLGEHRSSLRLPLDWQRFVMFNHDTVPTENQNLYGSHPFYLVMEEEKNSHGVFLLNSNAMEVILQPAPAITFRTIGGVLDFFIFLGPTPSDVIRQYTDIVGRPYFPPYWGLGFHLCRFGLHSLNETKEVMNRNRHAGIPLDVQWNDLDYMDSSNDFTYDKKRFRGLPEFVDHLHKIGMHYVPIIDAGVSAGERPGSYPPFDEGLALGIFVKNTSGEPFIGKVWNRVSTVWPDFTHPQTVAYWLKQLHRLHWQVQFDGAWIDMNEPSNFYSGTSSGCPNNNLEHPPYVPAVNGGKLFYRTLCMSSIQHAGHHYNTHNLYGFSEAIVTSFALTEIRGRRPFVISRSTFAGHGHYAGHWSGDVYSDWHSMEMSIPQLLSFSLFGIPLMGTDICGFNGNTTVDLCQRWMQLGAFYPFSRNHNTDDGIPQDPAALGPAVIESSRKALLIRYSLLPYLYTLFWRAHAFGDTVARPLFIEFPDDPETYGIDKQFLWGPALMIVPVLKWGETFVTGYFPKSIWYNLHTLGPVTAKQQSWHDITAPLDTIPLFYRGGHIIPLQSPNMTTTASRKNPVELIVAKDEDGKATGSLYWDDGDSVNTYEDKKYSHVTFTLNESRLRGTVVWWGYDAPLMLGKVHVLGIGIPVRSVYVNQVAHSFSYNSGNQFLRIKNLALPLNQNFSIHWV
ncbi:uncharacterized protein GBIM_09481 [Gryllus bimaculatus]|nr:uncharacterized protein GBIM_09481 [Gryllus bimaculatus]